MPTRKRHPLFSAYGLRVDYAFVDGERLETAPIAEHFFEQPAPVPVEGQRRDFEILPGIAAHSVTLRNGKVMRKPDMWVGKLAKRTAALTPVLERDRALLLPGGAHPFYQPARDGIAGKGMAAGARALCDKLFDMRGHGWSNDQALRLGLYFDKADEFGKLHAAVRLLLPLLPALAAASPILEGRNTGFLSSRLESALRARERVPELMGGLVPEAVFDRDDHDREILGPIAQALALHDPDRLLDPQLMNARGATTHFDRGIMMLHVIDAQECPSSNLAVAEFIIAVLKALVTGRWVSTYLQRAWGVDDLQGILLSSIKDGERTTIANHDYLLMFGLMKQEQMSAQKMLQHLFVELYGELSENARARMGHILEHGSLATRIIAKSGKRPSADKVRSVYTTLAECHRTDKSFV